ncbi:MAG: hypothetical protein V6Z89_20425 [Desulfobacter sp.]
MKKIFFVSTGRCGTRRIYEILKEKCPGTVVRHQMPCSRLANIVGNLMYIFGQSDRIKKIFCNIILARHPHKKHFISCDPLTAMMIPYQEILNPNTMVIHVYRPKNTFADSFFRRSRTRVKSLIAHNFIPFWQIGVWPLENILNKNIKNKYIRVHELKYDFFQKQYSKNPNFKQITMEEVFKSDFLEKTINLFLNQNLSISNKDLAIISNH